MSGQLILLRFSRTIFPFGGVGGIRGNMKRGDSAGEVDSDHLRARSSARGLEESESIEGHEDAACAVEDQE
jgi:hypothetical protein